MIRTLFPFRLLSLLCTGGIVFLILVFVRFSRLSNRRHRMIHEAIAMHMCYRLLVPLPFRADTNDVSFFATVETQPCKIPATFGGMV